MPSCLSDAILYFITCTLKFAIIHNFIILEFFSNFAFLRPNKLGEKEVLWDIPIFNWSEKLPLPLNNLFSYCNHAPTLF